MAYAAPNDFASCAGATASPKFAAGTKKAGILRRFFDSFMESRQQETNRQIGRFLEQSGGRFSDEVERELMRRVSRSDWSVPE